jgi:Bifunctional DNA primase/polymerase, N-terminal
MTNTAPRQTRNSRWSPRLPIELSEASDLAAASAMLARRGIPVFPCATGGKQPLTNHGFRDATHELTTVQGWWRRWPDANIGMPTGAPSGVDVVDVDVHPAGSGFGAFERARAAGHVVGWAWLVRTPSSGVHAYFLRSGPEAQRSWQVPSRHIDFRGDGGYIILPPSRVATADGTTRRYELIAVAQHLPEPVDAGALRSFLEPPRPTPPPHRMPGVRSRPDKLATWVAGRPVGARNHGLFWAACRMLEEGNPFNATADLLGDAARSAGLSEQEAMTTIRSAYRITAGLQASSTARPTTVEAVSL